MNRSNTDCPRAGEPSGRLCKTVLVSVLSGGVLMVAGCGAPFETRVPDVVLTPAHIVFMPVVTKAYEIDFDDRVKRKSQSAQTMATYFNAEIAAQATRRGASLFSPENLQGCDDSCIELLASFVRWGVNASMEIAARGRADYGKYSVGSWEARRDYEPLRSALKADFALIVVVRDAQETSGRVVGNFFAGVDTYFKRVAVACVAEFLYGRMVWCHSEVDFLGNLQDPRTTHNLVLRLLSDL